MKNMFKFKFRNLKIIYEGKHNELSEGQQYKRLDLILFLIFRNQNYMIICIISPGILRAQHMVAFASVACHCDFRSSLSVHFFSPTSQEADFWYATNWKKNVKRNAVILGSQPSGPSLVPVPLLHWS